MPVCSWNTLCVTLALCQPAVCSWDVVMERCDDHQCIFSSPGYPGIYPPNTDCFYHVTSSDNDAALQLTFRPDPSLDTTDHFDIHESAQCLHEYVEVRDGANAGSSLIGRFCGRQVADITSTGPALYLAFITRKDGPPYDRTGFQAYVQSVTKEWHEGGTKQPLTPCDWTFSALEGSVSSPGHWLPHHAKCTYDFIGPPHHQFDIRIHIYGLSADCSSRLEVSDGGRIVARLCDVTSGDRGGESRRTFHYNTTTATSLTVDYYMRDGQMQADPLKGFWLSFRWIPAGSQGVRGIHHHQMQSSTNDAASTVFDAYSQFQRLYLAIGQCLLLYLIVITDKHFVLLFRLR